MTTLQTKKLRRTKARRQTPEPSRGARHLRSFQSGARLEIPRGELERALAERYLLGATSGERVDLRAALRSERFVDVWSLPPWGDVWSDPET